MRVRLIASAISFFLPIAGFSQQAAFIDASHYGVVGDGAANNNAAFSSMFATADKEIHLGAGTYLLTPQSFRMTHGVSLVGAGRGTTIIKIAVGSVFHSDLFVWIDQKGFSIRDLTIDLSGAEASSLISAIALRGDSNFDVSDVEIVGGNTKMLLIAANGVSDFLIAHNRLMLLAAAGTQNQCLNISSSAGGSVRGRVLENVCINTGMDIDASSTEISRNEISGWAFGAGITTEQDAAHCFGLQIADNKVHDSATGADSNNFFPAGIEHWCADSSITGNRSWNNASDGFDLGGRNTRVNNNTAWGNGTNSAGRGGNGFASRYGDATFNADGSVYSGNTAYDTGTGTQLYGYADQNAKLSGIRLLENKFSGAKAPMNVLGSPPK